MVSTRVCGTLSSGSNPGRHPTMQISFPKDLLVVDFESSNKDLEKAEPLQIGAVLLDKDTLEEKSFFKSFIYNDLINASPETLAINGITSEKLKDAPSQKQVAEEFLKIFGVNFTFAGWVCEKDRALFRKMMISANINPSDFDFRVYDIWVLAFTYLLKNGYNNKPNSEEMFQTFGLPARGCHDALEDCRYAADVLRKILK